MCREWHIWWRTPYGENPQSLLWYHWRGLRKFRKPDPNKNIDMTIPGSAWRRYLNSVGYPLIGPYDSSQDSVIKWQLQTAKNTGMECLHVHLWPSIWDKGQSFTPIPVFDKILEQAAKMKFPVAVHDEIQFRNKNISQAQKLSNSIVRISKFLNRYKDHPGFYKTNGLPVYYFQNWNKWLSAKNMKLLLNNVEKKVGPVYWIVEMYDLEDYVKISEIKAFVSHNNSWFLWTKPYGKGPHPWAKLEQLQTRSSKLARKYNKKFGILIYTRFNNNNDRGKEGRGIMPGENGFFFIKSIKSAMKSKPDFLIITQWNDYQEGAFIEPAFLNGISDPYFYCRLLALSQNKKFTPAKLPERNQIDPYIRHKLFGNSKLGDLGPVLYDFKLESKNCKWKWSNETAIPQTIKFYQNKLGHWRPNTKFKYNAPLRLANFADIDSKGTLMQGMEMRFYVPGMIYSQPVTAWLGVRAKNKGNTKIIVRYRAQQESFRIDSRWDDTETIVSQHQNITQKDGSILYWLPLYRALFTGHEGDLIIKLFDKKGQAQIKDVILWSPLLPAAEKLISLKDTSCDLPKAINKDQPFIVCGFDSLNNPGLPIPVCK